VGLFPDEPKFLLEKANGDEVVDVKEETLGLKSRVSDDLKLFLKRGISFVNLSSLYDSTLYKSPRSLDGTE
jgi:hypothetical protein